MTAAYFEDHPTDPDKVILRKKPYLDKGRDYEEGFVDGMQHQMQSSADKAVNAMSRTWVGLTDEERQMVINKHEGVAWETAIAIEQTLKEKNV